MNKTFFFSIIAAAVLTFGAAASAAERLAVAEPVAKGGIPAEEIEALWGMLEASVDGELVTRSALQAIMTELGLANSSGLMNLDDAQKASFGEIKGVDKILVPTISRFGKRINITLLLMDVSTGVMDSERRTTVTINSLDELADQLPDLLTEMGLGRPLIYRGKSALLTPIIRVADSPSFLPQVFNTSLEDCLIENGIRLQNLQSVRNILMKNNIGDLNELEPAMYRRVGELLRVDYLLQATINRFEISLQQQYIQLTRQTMEYCVGSMEGTIRVIAAQTGEIVASKSFRWQDTLNGQPGWNYEDYGRFLIENSILPIAHQILPKLKQ